jgi:hypothetical protein
MFTVWGSLDCGNSVLPARECRNDLEVSQLCGRTVYLRLKETYCPTVVSNPYGRRGTDHS